MFSMETIKLDDFSNHWKDSLLGESFWREQDRLNRTHQDRIETIPARSLTLHKQFPFNLHDEQGPRNRNSQQKRRSQQPVALSPKKQKQKNRRFSTSDALHLNTLSFSPATNLLHEFNKHGHADSRLHSLSHSHSSSNFRSPVKLARRAGSLLRASFRLSTTDERTTSPGPDTPVQKSPSSPGKTIPSFRGGEAWDNVSRETERLCFDIFIPLKSPEYTPKPNESENAILEIDQLSPLCEFRNLRVLKITGMMQSYQKYIWRAAWVNLNLEELELGMALAPRVKQKYMKSGSEWQAISGDWTFEVPQYCDPVY
ncbi:hypothetical protein PHISCL_03909 [Aspergillus sclerotialis]|uniref:Uncharacterized protein n=1 Tax=Aspergillus sclerotialis TaxID=2070753 RepID=A0A3A2ZKN5_9EURO|nr:hypothetical protein PHISCL_03909 [Aspergillus sclerotialis]